MSTSLIFDTSAINTLENGAGSDAIIRGLTSGFDVILTATTAEEIIATPTPQRREALLSRLGRFLNSSQCIWPAPEVLRLLISAHVNDPAGFDWRKVNVRAEVYEHAIARRDFDDTLCAEQRRYQFATAKEFKKLWADLRPELDRILAKEPSNRPSTYKDAVSIAVRDGGVLWGFGQWLYSVSKKTVTETEIRSFIELCPPFRAACYGLVMAWYNGSLRNRDGTPTAGRNDLLMAAYLPYCLRFVTDDWPQRNELRGIAQAARIECEVLSMSDLEKSLLISV